MFDRWVYLNGCEIGLRPSDSSPKGVDCGDTRHGSSMFVDHQPEKLGVKPYNCYHSNSSFKIDKNQDKPIDSTLKFDDPRAELNSVSTGEVSASHADEIGEDKKLTSDHRGILPNACLPCISSIAVPVDKRRPTSPETTSSRKKSLSKLSFKWREGTSDTALGECSQ